MKIVYHPKFKDSTYATDPAAEEGRIKCIVDELNKNSELEFIKPDHIGSDTLELVHTPDHVEEIKRKEKLYDMARLSAGGAIKSAEIACDEEPAFAVIRPPGHHASPNSYWGFCYFNNMALSIENLRAKTKIRTAFIIDFDLHTGDGNLNCLGSSPGITIINPPSVEGKKYLDNVKTRLNEKGSFDILGVSAGFDEHKDDWGGNLRTGDYRELGKILKIFSDKKCDGRRFALLEGGYNHDVLGKNVAAFVNGFSD